MKLGDPLTLEARKVKSIGSTVRLRAVRIRVSYQGNLEAKVGHPSSIGEVCQTVRYSKESLMTVLSEQAILENGVTL